MSITQRQTQIQQGVQGGFSFITFSITILSEMRKLPLCLCPPFSTNPPQSVLPGVGVWGWSVWRKEIPLVSFVSGPGGTRRPRLIELRQWLGWSVRLTFGNGIEVRHPPPSFQSGGICSAMVVRWMVNPPVEVTCKFGLRLAAQRISSFVALATARRWCLALLDKGWRSGFGRSGRLRS